MIPVRYVGHDDDQLPYAVSLELNDGSGETVEVVAHPVTAQCCNVASVASC